MLITNLISRYMRLCKAAFSAEDGAKLNKSIQTNVMALKSLQRPTTIQNKHPYIHSELTKDNI